MKILIITRSFVREVSSFVKHAEASAPSLQFSVILPYYHDVLPAEVNILPLYFSHCIRGSFYPLRSLVSQIRTFRPDIVHVFEEYSGLMAFHATLFARLCCRHSKIIVYSAENIPDNIRSVLRLPTKYVMAQADLAAVCSHGVKEVLKQEGFSKNIQVFPLGVDTSTFYKFPYSPLKAELQLDSNFVLGYIGRLLRIKGIFFLLEVLRELPENVHLLLLGSGPEDRHLRYTAVKLGVEKRVHILGEIAYQQLPDYINCMDIGIVPSHTSKRWKEQFGRALVEMMSCELTVLGSDSGSIPEVLGNREYIFRDGDVRQLVTMVQTLMHAPKTRQSIGQRGRQRVQTFYSIEQMYQGFFTMYQQLCKKQGETGLR
ncbi:hypothetical protein CSB45_07990 [candidate division KSB3 bacterium]|uniref:Glycosyl transferase family 1 domain-containing protein n=1 Tax=candidate division KSB3 bacterium TaxID=2044937 RepID=A0A2G6E5X2_9BACT|nr:MAG: hypothetical protein CSB45_07990 [candidate division KSB3 bacterium]PIE29838.1 MAG: hypothetical protein CSA57_07230 [candidate division KSB3 bacterium]